MTQDRAKIPADLTTQDMSFNYKFCSLQVTPVLGSTLSVNHFLKLSLTVFATNCTQNLNLTCSNWDVFLHYLSQTFFEPL